MIKKILLLAILMLTWVGTVKAEGGVQTQTLTLFESTTEYTAYIPLYGYDANRYQKCEMIYPAEYLNDLKGKSISQMVFYLQTKATIAWNATFEVYLKEVSQSTYSSASFIGFSEADLVYRGPLNGNEDTMPVVFNQNKTYNYQGGNLLVGVYLTEKGSYKSAWFYAKSMGSNVSIQGAQGSQANCRVYLPKVTFYYSSAGPELPPPTTLDTGDITETSATLSWKSTASAWQICINDDEENLIDVDEEDLIDVDDENKTYALTDLVADHNYEVKIRAVNGTQKSKWSSTVSIRTLSCSPDQMVNISYELHDDRDDGWQGSAIIVKDALTNEELATWTIESGSSASGTLPVCLGRELKFEFVWITGTYTQDCSYEVYDPNGEIIVEGTRDQVEPIEYTVSVANPRPTDLRVPGIGIDRALIYWSQKGDAAQWQLCINNDMDHLILVSSKLYMLTNLEDDTNYTLMVRAYKDADNISKWSEPVSFTTKEVCPKPINLSSGEPTPYETTLSWDGSLTSYVLQYNAWWKRGEDVLAVNTHKTYEFSLRGFGETGSIAIRHYNVSDKFWLHIDDIVVTDAEGTTVYSEDFENSEGYMPAKLSSIDRDGDGYGWEVKKNLSEWRPFVNGEYGISSATYKPGEDKITPDDWLIISDVRLGGKLSFVGYSQTYNDDVFAVYVLTDNWMQEVPVNGNSYHVTQLFKNVPYTWRVKGIKGEKQSRWASSMFETLDDPYSITTGIEEGQKDLVKGQKDEWFTIDGRKLSGKPNAKGLYVNNGNKVVIK